VHVRVIASRSLPVLLYRESLMVNSKNHAYAILNCSYRCTIIQEIQLIKKKMSKAKIVLSAILIVTIIGGIFSIKAARIVNIWYQIDSRDKNCTIPTVFKYTTNIQQLNGTSISTTFLDTYAHPGSCTRAVEFTTL
jgi:hypothetical protein